MESSPTEQKQPLLTLDDEPRQRASSLSIFEWRAAGNSLLVAILILQVCLSIFLAGVVWSRRTSHSSTIDLAYSPIEHDVRYEVRRWNTSIGVGKTKYMGQSDVVDAEWEMLFKYGLDQIPKETARLLADQTAPIPGDPDNYIFSFEVFHLLHCLNLLRKRFHPEYYPPPPPENAIAHQHAEHCVDILRQSMMCAVDINPLVWQWNHDINATVPKLDALHECRSWDDVWNWSVEHRIRTPFDEHAHLAIGL